MQMPRVRIQSLQGAEETMTEQVTVIDLVQVYAESPTSEPVNDVTQSLSGTNKVNEHVKFKDHLKKKIPN